MRYHEIAKTIKQSAENIPAQYFLKEAAK